MKDNFVHFNLGCTYIILSPIFLSLQIPEVSCALQGLQVRFIRVTKPHKEQVMTVKHSNGKIRKME